MGKKRLFTVARRAQITIFMILGLLLFFIFLFLMQVALKAEEIKLSAEQEKVLTKAFKKESLRLFVDDCLQDELEQGLILLGKQGTLWADQPGGVKQFSEGINGITTSFDGEPSRIAYAITNETYFAYSNAFPCNEELNSPAFCFYQYPNTLIKFGNRKLFPSTFTQDLQQYLLDRTARCVQSFIHSEVSEHAEIIATDIELELTITNEGIGVKIDYPLKFKVGGEEIFSLSTFDFFYPSRFNQLLDTAASPLRWELELVDFNYTEETFSKSTFSYGSEQNLVGYCLPEGNYFQCERALALDTYQSLGVDMNTESPPNGDDIFTFTPALYEIVNNPEPYSLRIARQNRPPALDYVQRDACPTEGYDYLVIKEDPERGDINIIPHALDADEDDFSISFSPELGAAVDEVLYRPAASVAAIPQDLYTLKVTATDEHGKEDSQDVRVLVDRPIRLGLSLAFPEEYAVDSQIGDSNRYVVSKEDPILLQAVIPAGTETANVQTIALEYSDGTYTNNFARLDYNNPDISTEQCYNLPLQTEGDAPTCIPGQEYDLNPYYTAADKINGMTTPNYYTFHPFQRSTSLENLGILSLNFNTQYCAVPLAEQQSIVEVLVKDCVPLRNAEHPFASPHEKHKFGLTAEGTTNWNNYLGEEEINPFAATHSCCRGDPDPLLAGGWKIKTADDDPCFINPELGCYGQLRTQNDELLTSLTHYRGYIQEQQQRFCDAEMPRGNQCLGEFESLLPDGKLRCGDSSMEGCDNVESRCSDLLSYSFVENEGWCSGRFGCADFCSEEVVYTGTEPGSYFTSDYLNGIATELALEQGFADVEGTDQFPFHCRCQNPEDDRKPCDGNFDGRFSDAVCDAGECRDLLSCTPNQNYCNQETEADYRDRRQCNNLQTGWNPLSSCAVGEEGGLGEYCREGRCLRQTCTPGGPLSCYRSLPTAVKTLREEEIRREEPERLNEWLDIMNHLVFACDEDGSDYENIVETDKREDGTITGLCPNACSTDTTVVEIITGAGTSDERKEWECRRCGPGDIRPQKNCKSMDGREGVCADTRTGSPRYQCRS